MKNTDTPYKKVKIMLTCCGLTLLPFVSVAQEVLFFEDFENLASLNGAPLEGQNGWEAARAGSNTPTINVTATYGVAAAGTSGGGFAQKDIGNLGLTPSSKLQLDMTIELSNSNESSQQFNVAMGVGPGISPDEDSAPLHIGAQWGGFYLRQDNWGNSATAVDSTGTPIRLVAIEIYEMRAIWDFAANTATLMQRNVTQGEEEFTQLYFDPAQTISEVGLGEYPDVTTWDTVWIRLGTSLGARLLDLTLSDPEVSSSDTWAGYPVTDGTLVDTGSFLGWLYIGESDQRSDWVYAYSLESYIYLPEDHAASTDGSWLWIPNS